MFVALASCRDPAFPSQERATVKASCLYPNSLSSLSLSLSLSLHRYFMIHKSWHFPYPFSLSLSYSGKKNVIFEVGWASVFPPRKKVKRVGYISETKMNALEKEKNSYRFYSLLDIGNSYKEYISLFISVNPVTAPATDAWWSTRNTPTSFNTKRVSGD